MVYTGVLEASPERVAGSSPVSGTKTNKMGILKIHNAGLTGYYLEQTLGGKPLIDSGLIISQEDDDSDEPSTIELHYTDEKDLEAKVSLIIEMLTDK